MSRNNGKSVRASAGSMHRSHPYNFRKSTSARSKYPTASVSSPSLAPVGASVSDVPVASAQTNRPINPASERLEASLIAQLPFGSDSSSQSTGHLSRDSGPSTSTPSSSPPCTPVLVITASASSTILDHLPLHDSSPSVPPASTSGRLLPETALNGHISASRVPSASLPLNGPDPASPVVPNTVPPRLNNTRVSSAEPCGPVLVREPWSGHSMEEQPEPTRATRMPAHFSVPKLEGAHTRVVPSTTSLVSPHEELSLPRPESRVVPSRTRTDPPLPEVLPHTPLLPPVESADHSRHKPSYDDGFRMGWNTWQPKPEPSPLPALRSDLNAISFAQGFALGRELVSSVKRLPHPAAPPPLTVHAPQDQQPAVSYSQPAAWYAPPYWQPPAPMYYASPYWQHPALMSYVPPHQQPAAPVQQTAPFAGQWYPHPTGWMLYAAPQPIGLTPAPPTPYAGQQYSQPVAWASYAPNDAHRFSTV